MTFQFNLTFTDIIVRRYNIVVKPESQTSQAFGHVLSVFIMFSLLRRSHIMGGRYRQKQTPTTTMTLSSRTRSWIYLQQPIHRKFILLREAAAAEGTADINRFERPSTDWRRPEMRWTSQFLVVRNDVDVDNSDNINGGPPVTRLQHSESRVCPYTSAILYRSTGGVGGCVVFRLHSASCWW